MSRYQINDLEQLTGIKAHTIRIWEKRYQLIQPYRTATNIRYYDDEQVKKLLNVATLVHFGHKISRIAQMEARQLNDMVSNLQNVESDDAVNASYITSLTSSMLSFDENLFERTLSAAFTRHGVYNGMIQVVYPFLAKTGVLWSINETMPIQEHFATGILRRKLLAAIDGLPAAKESPATFLLFLPQDEWHEVGLLLTHFLTRSMGFKTLYFGQNVPFDNLHTTIPHIRPTHFITFYIMRKKSVDIPAEFVRLASNIGDARLVVCGREDMLAQLPAHPSIDLCSDANAMIEYLKSV